MGKVLENEDRELYVEALSALNECGVAYMLGGAFAVYHYTNWWRHTHDMDVYVTHDCLQSAVRALASAGFRDLGEHAKGDADWIYHAGKGPIMVDVIWRLANLVEYIRPDWFDRAPRGRFLGMEVVFVPLEELLWMKLFVINRHRCDWPDVFRIVKAQCADIDWDMLLERLGEHWLLMAGLIDIFDWQHPHSMGCIPDRIRAELARRRESYGASSANVEREQLLDPWIDQRADGYATWRDE